MKLHIGLRAKCLRRHAFSEEFGRVFGELDSYFQRPEFSIQLQLHVQVFEFCLIRLPYLDFHLFKNLEQIVTVVVHFPNF